MPPQTFYIYGYYGSKNAGDEAFRLAFRHILPSHSSLRFIRPSELADNLDLSSQIRQDVAAGKARLIVGGGAIIGEPYFWAHLPAETPFHVISADIGSQDNLVNRYIPSLAQMQTSWIRSETDAAQLRKLTSLDRSISYLPDIVHSLGPSPEDSQVVASLDRATRNRRLLELMEKYCENTQSPDKLRDKNMAIFLSDHYYDYKTIQSGNVLEALEREASDRIFLRNLRLSFDEISPYYNLYFFSLSYWYNSIDAFVGYRLARASSQSVQYNILSRYIDPAEILSLMPYFDTAVSMKFHGLIFPLTAGIPVMNIGNSKKNQDLARQMGIVSVSPEEMTMPLFMTALKQVESIEYSTSLTESQRLAREAIHVTFSNPDLWD
ncbi:polysaccharide pyruvyl transferase family protein [Synechococcus sp. CCY 0621]|uniref:polysaccharide pyruvyl transferase family protein n=1 Tax=Synechococcus sp. CCY 0621 TaxID=2815603 RepID=UPI001C213A30|nr:polysaccharide pyruvyl transferase family protein [Synechococcus sp. CCY 0621]